MKGEPMLNQPTIEKLYAMRMRGMADAFTQQQQDPQTSQLSFEERFALLVDRQWNWRENRALERRLRDAVGGGEKGYQFGGRDGARCGVTLWPTVGPGMREGELLSSLRPDCLRF
jgi:hypothetical protein